MEYLDYPFTVSVGSGRRPTPTTFEHLRKYSVLELAYQKISSQVDITNINSILEQTANLYVSNEIHRVIAQLVGELDPGFITIKGTALGALHVYPAGGDEDGKIDVKVADGDNYALGAYGDSIVSAGAPGTLSAKLRRATQGLEDLKSLVVLAAGSNLIGNVKVAGTSQVELSAVINIATATTHDIIAAVGAKSHHITSIVFTVNGEVNITLKDETGNLTGAMDFGGTDEPRGMALNFGLASLKCTVAEKFQILLSAAVQVSGVATYYDE